MKWLEEQIESGKLFPTRPGLLSSFFFSLLFSL